VLVATAHEHPALGIEQHAHGDPQGASAHSLQLRYSALMRT
jgi:hypothetical protein